MSDRMTLHHDKFDTREKALNVAELLQGIFVDTDITHHEWEVRWDGAERAYLLCLIYVDRADPMVDYGGA